MSIPQDIIDKYAPLADGARFFGMPVQDMSREELLVVLGFCADQIQRERAHAAQNARMEAFFRERGV